MRKLGIILVVSVSLMFVTQVNGTTGVLDPNFDSELPMKSSKHNLLNGKQSPTSLGNNAEKASGTTIVIQAMNNKRGVSKRRKRSSHRLVSLKAFKRYRKWLISRCHKRFCLAYTCRSFSRKLARKRCIFCHWSICPTRRTLP